jgi:hypothetical protein
MRRKAINDKTPKSVLLMSEIVLRKLPQNKEYHSDESIHSLITNRGFTNKHQIRKKSFILDYYLKPEEEKRLLQFENGNFIASSGSLIYKEKSGKDALLAFYKDFDTNALSYKDIQGHFAIFIFIKGKLYICKDLFGYFPLFCNHKNGAISTSFLAVLYTSEKMTLNLQAMYEYIHFGFFFSVKTFFDDIKLLEDECWFEWQSGELHSQTVQLHLNEVYVNESSFDDTVENLLRLLLKKFSAIANAFKGRVNAGLSGGFDSRTMFLLLLALDIKPMLFVNGTPGSDDINKAKEIANQAKMKIQINHWYEYYKPFKKDPAKFVKERFWGMDGMGSGGLFDDWSDYEMRKTNGFNPGVVLNGGGGEVFREGWQIPNRSNSLTHIVNAYYNKGVPVDYFKQPFDMVNFFIAIANRIQAKLGYDSGRVSYSAFDQWHKYRHRSALFTNSMTHRFADYYLPFVEPDIIAAGISLPYKWKRWGKMQIAIMQKLSPRIASLPSSYGYSFANPIPAKARFRDAVGSQIPLTIRPWLRQFKKSRKLDVKTQGHSLLDDTITASILDLTHPFLHKYFNSGVMVPHLIRSRTYSIAYLITTLEKMNKRVSY